MCFVQKAMREGVQIRRRGKTLELFLLDDFQNRDAEAEGVDTVMERVPNRSLVGDVRKSEANLLEACRTIAGETIAITGNAAGETSHGRPHRRPRRCSSHFPFFFSTLNSFLPFFSCFLWLIIFLGLNEFVFRPTSSWI